MKPFHYFLINALVVGAYSFNLFEVLGCAAGCVYKPTNAVALQACATAARLKGGNVTIQFECAKFSDPDECVKQFAQSEEDEPCVWVPTPEGFEEQFGAGSCMAHRLGTPPDMISTGMRIFYDAVKQYNVPKTKEMNECLEHSFTDRKTCVANSDSSGRKCGWCEDLPNLYPMKPQFKTMCLQADIVEGACDMLKRDDEVPLCNSKTTPEPWGTESTAIGESTTTTASTDEPSTTTATSTDEPSTTKRTLFVYPEDPLNGASSTLHSFLSLFLSLFSIVSFFVPL